MTMQYEFVVLRLSPSLLRGENINIGFVIFPDFGVPMVRITASVPKVRAIDPSWSRSKAIELEASLLGLLDPASDKQASLDLLSQLGYTSGTEPGFFYASDSGLESEIRNLSKIYVSDNFEKNHKQRKNKLHQEMVQRFRSMDILGTSIDDLSKHRIVPHVPIPNNPDLRGDFVYKNGVYRITQTLDYRVSPMGAHQKVAEACTKVMAASLGAKEGAWGESTKKYALVCVPAEVADIADSHLDLLYASGFEIFHADNQSDLARYHSVAFGY